MSEQDNNQLSTWAILELMGHRRLAGFVSEQVIGGASFIRIDIPETKDQAAFSQFYSGGAVYCITPTTEDIARKLAANCFSRPVQRYEIGAATLTAPEKELFDEDDPGASEL